MSKMDGRLHNHVALITGAGSGIGRATALMFAEQGALVGALDRNLEAAQAVASVNPERILPLCADVSKSAEVKTAVQACAERFGDPTIVVNVAGAGGVVGQLLDTDEAEWDRLLSVNVKGTFFTIQHCLPAMLARNKGAIVNVSSTAGLVGSAVYGAYSASKGAVVLMTRSLAVTYGDQGVRANCVCPGSIDTPMLMQSFMTAGEAEGNRIAALYRSKQPLGRRFGKTDEVAAAILFLASDEASFITGVALPVDGGRIA